MCGREVRFMGLQLSLINLVFLFSHIMPKINNKSLVHSDTFDFFKKNLSVLWFYNRFKGYLLFSSPILLKKLVIK